VTRRRVCVIYEHGADLRPFGSAQIRLLRPLSHPVLQEGFATTFNWAYRGESAEAVIVDRLWRPDLSLAAAHNLVQDIRRAGARFIYALDDDFLSLPLTAAPGYFNAEKRRVAEFWLREADGVLVTTPALQQRLSSHTSKCVILPNALDERLLIGGPPPPLETPFGPRRITIGYMGTFSHEADWQLILPAWQKVYEQYGDMLEFQVIGISERVHILAQHAGVPVRIVQPRAEEIEYPLFTLWFTGRVQWDIAVAPLLDTPFTQCKSDIKFLDYSALGAATIASRIPVYEASVQHGKTGWLAENTVEAWVNALNTLIVDAELRSALVMQAQRYLWQERTLAQRAMDWKSTLDRLIDNSPGNQGV
jgi:glycosyltransferase involved in cell wall biosynthesis